MSFQMGEARRLAMEGLHRMGQMLTSLDCFDSEDVETWRKEVARSQEVDEELLALQRLLPERQHYMEKLDAQYKLSRYYPAMMRAFSQKDAELQVLLDAKVKAHEEKMRAQ